MRLESGAGAAPAVSSAGGSAHGQSVVRSVAWWRGDHNSRSVRRQGAAGSAVAIQCVLPQEGARLTPAAAARKGHKLRSAADGAPGQGVAVGLRGSGGQAARQRVLVSMAGWQQSRDQAESACAAPLPGSG